MDNPQSPQGGSQKKTVYICGTARNLALMPEPKPGIEVWASNCARGTIMRNARIIEKSEWTRWFNIHSTKHMRETYPKWHDWYKQQVKPIYLRDVDPQIPASVRFPREEVQNYFGGPQMGSPGRYFTFTAAWLTGLAIMEGFERIEYHGFALRDKPARTHDCYRFERPCFWYWVKQARDRGIEVTYPKEVHAIPFKPGDPVTYTGLLYGYETTEPKA